jgi:RNA polymerase sigma factor (sigma-70 family)
MGGGKHVCCRKAEGPPGTADVRRSHICPAVRTRMTGTLKLNCNNRQSMERLLENNKNMYSYIHSDVSRPGLFAYRKIFRSGFIHILFQEEQGSSYFVFLLCCSFRITVFIFIMTELSKQRFFELMQPVRDRLIWHIYVMTRDEEEARDIAQDAMLLAYDGFDSLRNESSFEFFIFRIARREFIRNRKRRRLFVHLDGEHENIPSEACQALETGYDVQLLLDCIASLPQRQRETISLFKIGGFSMEEIREIQGGTLSGVKTRLMRARRSIEFMMNEGRTVPRHRPTEIIALGDEA